MIRAQELVERGLEVASAAGADGCIVLVEERSHADVRFAVNTTTTNGLPRGRTVSVVALSGTAAGTARRAGVVGIDGVEEMVRAALGDARAASPAEDASPLVAPADARPARDFELDPELTDASVLEGVLSALAGAFGRARSRGAVLAGFTELDVQTAYVGTSTGVRLSHAQPTGAVNLVGRTDDGKSSAWVGAPTVTPDFSDMEAELWRRLDWAGRQVSLDPGRYEVLLPPSGVADMIAILAFGGLGGQDAEDGRSVFSKEGGGTRIGEVVTSRPFTLFSDPAEPGVECAPFLATGASSSEVSVFDNGLPLGRIEWLRAGTLAHLRHHRAGAARAGVEVAPYVDNLVLTCADTGGGSLDDMVARTERGLLLTCLWYIREVDPATLLVTGLTRDGVYVVENGVVTGAANNFRFNESPVDLLGRASEVGTPVRALGREFGEYFNRTIMPPLRIPDFNMSSVSQAS
jgi:predicted Zn-dependent protease